MYTYIQNGVRKLVENGAETNRVTIFVNGNAHKGEKHFASKQLNLQQQTNNVDEIWSQVYPYLKQLYMDGKKSNASSNYTNNTENQTNNIFEISIPYNIPSDGKEYVVAIQEYKAPAVYSYTAIPKLDKDAFLLANLINWDQTGLLPGEANLFNEGTFVGKSYFETRVTNDTIPVSLGREKNIILDRKKVKSFTEKNFTGGTKKTTLEFEIMVRNKKKAEVEITIEDQIPLSNTEEVTIELINGSNATYVKETGKLKWIIKLTPSESNTLKFGYIIKYPKKYNISNL